MKKIDKIVALANKFEQLAAQAQLSSAQAGDVQRALENAKLFNASDIGSKVAELLPKAKIPETSTVQIDILVDKNLNPNYSVTLNPPSSASAVLGHLVKTQFAGPMKKALTDANLKVSDTIATKWLHF